MKYNVLFCFVLLVFSSSIFAATTIVPGKCTSTYCFEVTAVSSALYLPNIENTVGKDITSINHSGFMYMEVTALGSTKDMSYLPSMCGYQSHLIEKSAFSYFGLTGYKYIFESSAQCFTTYSYVYPDYGVTYDKIEFR